METKKTKPYLVVGMFGHERLSVLTAAILAGEIRRSALNEVSLPALSKLDPKSKPEQEMTLVINPHNPSDATKAAQSFAELMKPVNSVGLKPIQSWNHPYPPSGRGRNKQ